MTDANADLARMVDAVFEPLASGTAACGIIETAATYRILAWPDYRSDSELRDLVRDYASRVTGQSDVSLCLLHVPGRDPRLEDAIDATARAWTRVLGAATAECLHFVDDAPTIESWAALGRSAHAVVALPSASSGARRSFVEAVGVPVVGRPAHLHPVLTSARVTDRGVRTEWHELGYEAWMFDGAVIVDSVPGPRLRTRFFRGARLEVIEPRAQLFAEHLRWSDLDRAHRVWSRSPAERIPELRGRACLVVVGDALEHADDPARCLAVAASYLAPGGELVAKRTRQLGSVLASSGLTVLRGTPSVAVLR